MSGDMRVMKYSDALKDPDISYTTLIEYYHKPLRVYKYQNFYDADGNINKYWQTNITGKTFRLNVASSFEDTNDCRPYFDKDKVIECFKNFYERSAPEKMEEKLKAVNEELTEAQFDHIVSKYQNSIHIGCLTSTASNDHMWEKYGNQHTGYCIEYEVSKNELLLHNMLPVIYEEKGFDSSYTFFLGVFLEAIKQGKKRSLEENLNMYADYYARWLKLVYLPAFIKGKSWKDEEEYRLFLLPQFTSAIRMVKADEEMDVNQCINLEKAVTAVHLGKQFKQNPDSDNLLAEIKKSLEGRNVSLFQRQMDGSEVKLI